MKLQLSNQPIKLGVFGDNTHTVLIMAECGMSLIYSLDQHTLHNVCNRTVKSEKATTWMFSDHYLTTIFTVANILQSSVQGFAESLQHDSSNQSEISWSRLLFYIPTTLLLLPNKERSWV